VKCKLQGLARLLGAARDERGQALVEYSLLIVLVAVTAIGAVQVFGLQVSKLYQHVIDVYP
jgi:Flp pilus assembly pilin Flp